MNTICTKVLNLPTNQITQRTLLDAHEFAIPGISATLYNEEDIKLLITIDDNLASLEGMREQYPALKRAQDLVDIVEMAKLMGCNTILVQSKNTTKVPGLPVYQNHHLKHSKHGYCYTELGYLNGRLIHKQIHDKMGILIEDVITSDFKEM